MPKLTAAVGAHDGVVVAVVIKVFIGDIAVAFRQQAQIIGVDKSSDGRIVISRFKIVPRQIDIVIVLFVADRVDLRNVVFMVKLCLPSVTNYMDLYGFVNRCFETGRQKSRSASARKKPPYDPFQSS